MAKQLTQLSAEQRAQVGPHTKRWIAIGHCTDPADRPRFEAGARACYGFARLAWPDRVVWVADPLVLSIAAPAADIILATGADRSGLEAYLADEAPALANRVRIAVDAATYGAPLGGGRVSADDIAEAVCRGHSRRVGGQFWAAGWYRGGAWASFFREVCGVTLADPQFPRSDGSPGDMWDRARAFEATIESACWWWPHRSFVMVSERPRSLAVHEVVGAQGGRTHQLHREDGPAIDWGTWGVWALNGVVVDEQIVMHPETLDLEAIMRIDNAEARRIAIERRGWDWFVGETGMSLVSEEDDPANPSHTLRLYALPPGMSMALYETETRLLLCTNASVERDGTRRRYGLSVPADIDSAVAAAAWMVDEPVTRYRQLARAT